MNLTEKQQVDDIILPSGETVLVLGYGSISMDCDIYLERLRAKRVCDEQDALAKHREVKEFIERYIYWQCDYDRQDKL